jgi:MobA/MobL family
MTNNSAIYRFRFQHGSRGKGSSAASHAKYILRYPPYRYNSEQLKHEESGNLPSWAKNGLDFWEKADKLETPLSARLYSEFVVSVPRCFHTEQQAELIKSFIKSEIAQKHTFTFALHHSPSSDGKGNHHAHIMFSPRLLDGIERDAISFFRRGNHGEPEKGGALKDRSWIAPSRLIDLRVSWEHHANRALNIAGFDLRIDHRSLKAQGIDRQPEPKLTPFESMLWKQGIATEKVQQIKAIRELKALEQKIDELQEKLKQHQSKQHRKELKREHDRTRDEYEKKVKELFSTLDKSETISNKNFSVETRLFCAQSDSLQEMLTLGAEFNSNLAKINELGKVVSTHFDESQKLYQKTQELRDELKAQGEALPAGQTGFKPSPLTVGQSERKVVKEHVPKLKLSRSLAEDMKNESV